MAHNFPLHMPPFDPDADVSVSVAPKWKLWVSDFKIILVANDITDPKNNVPYCFFWLALMAAIFFDNYPILVRTTISTQP